MTSMVGVDEAMGADSLDPTGELKMTKLNLDSISRDDLIKMIADVQYVIDGLWSDGYGIHRDTGIDLDTCDQLKDSIDAFCSINTK